MVLKTEVCRFSGLKIYPGHGMRLTKMDSQTYLFLNAKCKRLFNLRLRPAKLAWTTQYRKAHKKVRTRRTIRLRRARCALSRDVDVVSRVDARRRTARPLGKSHRSRVLGFFGHSARTGLGRTRETSRHTPRLPAPIGAAIDARARPRVGTVATRRPGDVASDSREARKIGFAACRHEGDATRFAGFRVETPNDGARKKKRANPKRVAHPFEPSIVKNKTGPNDRDRAQEEALGEDQQPLDRRRVSGGYPEEARGEVGCARRRARRRAARDQGAPAQGEGRQEGQEVMTVCETSHVMRERWRVRRLDCRRDDDDVTMTMIRFNRVRFADAKTGTPKTFVFRPRPRRRRSCRRGS